MKKLFKTLFESIIAPLVVIALTPSAVLIGSKLESGEWTQWLEKTPKEAWITFGIISVLWISAALIRRSKRRKTISPGIYVLRGGRGMKIGELPYAGVMWNIRAPTSPLTFAAHPSSVSPASIDVETPPRCPVCKTDLEEKRRLWGYAWKCIRCGFKKWNRRSYYQESERARRVAKVYWEEHLAETRNR